MAFDILTTKFYPPQIHSGIVDRPVLLNRFSRNAHRGLLLVSAPAGFGKSTAVAQWLASESRAAAWLSLDREDSEPSRFLVCVIHALRTVIPVGESLLPLLASKVKPSLISAMTSLLNEIAEWKQDQWLVFDDFHEIDSEDAVGVLGFLVENRPDNLRIIVSSREDPPIPLAKLRSRGQLAEVRIGDLKFSESETASFFERALHRPVHVDDIQALEERTEGWIAGIQLAAISLRTETNVSDFIESFTGSHRFILDYLLEEVLFRLSEGVQNFLLQTSVLDRFSAPLCDAVVRDFENPAEEVLKELERSNLFLISLDSHRQWYRYHHLFADLLRGRVTDTVPLHRRAGEWLEENGFTVEAFHHVISAGDSEWALRLLESGGVPFYFREAAGPVIRWIESLPEASRDEMPILWVHYAWALWTAYRSFAAQTAADRAQQALSGNHEPDQPTYRRSQGLTAALRAVLTANRYDMDAVFEESERALSLLSEHDAYFRTAVIRVQGQALHFQGRRDEARKAYRDVMARCEVSGDLHTKILATTGLGMIEESENNHRSAEKLHKSVLEMVGEPTRPVACESWLGLARIAYDRNELDTAAEQAAIGIELAETIEGIDTPISGRILQARIALARGRDRDAEQLLDDSFRQAVDGAFGEQAEATARYRIRLLLRRNRRAEARRIAEKYRMPLSSARVDLAEGEAENALLRIRNYLGTVEELKWADETQNARLLESAACWALGKVSRSVSILVGELVSLDREGRVRPVLDDGHLLMPVLEECVRRGQEPELSTRILAMADKESLGISGSPGVLSRRELEVLRLVAGGLSNREIGERLFLSLSTVKGHNASIFEKLGVRRRTEAIAQARNLGLL